MSVGEYISKDMCNERNKTIENLLGSDKTRLLMHDSEIRTVQEAIVVLTEIQRRHNEEINDHEGRLRNIEIKPAKRWDSITSQIIQLIIAAAIGGFISLLCNTKITA